MLAQGQSSSAKRGGLAADVSSGLIFLKKKKKIIVAEQWLLALGASYNHLESFHKIWIAWLHPQRFGLNSSARRPNHSSSGHSNGCPGFKNHLCCSLSDFGSLISNHLFVPHCLLPAEKECIPCNASRSLISQRGQEVSIARSGDQDFQLPTPLQAAGLREN